MNPTKLQEDFFAYIKDQFNIDIILNDFEKACLIEATSLAINSTENNLPITQAYRLPDLMKFVFQHWQSTVESWFATYPEAVPTNTNLRGVNIPVDHSSREQTAQLFDQLNSLFEQ